MSFPTLTDLEFYQGRKRPGWAGAIAKLTAGPSIDSVVNAHGNPSRLDTETHNMCAFVRGWLRRGEPLHERLAELATTSTGPQPRKRSALARKWLARL